MLAKLSRAAGEVGVLTNQDLDRIKAGLPSAFDTKEIIAAKKGQFQTLFDSTFNSAVDAYYNSVAGATGSRTTASSGSSSNPLGL
jgi:hypothetical protein